MYEKLRERAKKKVEAKVAFYICCIVFTFVTIVLLMLTYFLPGIGKWLMLPIPIFIMVLCILYISAFGLPITGEGSEDWKEEEIERELLRLYRRKKAQLPPLEELSEEERLELKEIREIQKKWDYRDEDFV
jgi:hypothetical protein